MKRSEKDETVYRARNDIHIILHFLLTVFVPYSFVSCSPETSQLPENADSAIFNESGTEVYSDVSAVRYKDETYEDARKRNKATTTKRINLNTAEEVAVPLEEVDFSKLENWEDYQEIVSAFENGRDERFLNWFYWLTYFPRRIPWLYPDDGCYLRADFMRTNLEDWGYPATMKLFVFGDLKIDTANHPDGSVSWWFHVVPIVSYNGTPMVFDAAINPERPMTLDEWTQSMAEEADVDTFRYSLCDAKTFIPYNSCYNPLLVPSMSLKKLLTYPFLNKEWRRIGELGRNPQEELGDNPPW